MKSCSNANLSTNQTDKNYFCHKSKSNHKNVDCLKSELEIDEHLISLPELCSRFHTNHITGLTDDQAKQLLDKFGKNIITPPPTKSNILLLLENFLGWFNMLLWSGAILCFVAAYFDEENMMNNIFLGLILALVVLVTGAFSYSQEKKSSKIMDSFKGKIIFYFNKNI